MKQFQEDQEGPFSVLVNWFSCWRRNEGTDNVL